MAADARQKEITRDLDAYISTKRKGGGLFGLFNKSESDTVGPREEPVAETPAELDTAPEVEQDDQEQAFDSSPAPETAPAQEQVSAPRKKGWFSRLFNEEEQPQTEPVVVGPSVDDDLREIARISLSFLRQADAEALARIKTSPDFERFKDILRKHNIIK